MADPQHGPCSRVPGLLFGANHDFWGSFHLRSPIWCPDRALPLLLIAAGTAEAEEIKFNRIYTLPPANRSNCGIARLDSHSRLVFAPEEYQNKVLTFFDQALLRGTRTRNAL